MSSITNYELTIITMYSPITSRSYKPIITQDLSNLYKILHTHIKPLVGLVKEIKIPTSLNIFK